jgi:hypothetical protein
MDMLGDPGSQDCDMRSSNSSDSNPDSGFTGEWKQREQSIDSGLCVLLSHARVARSRSDEEKIILEEA